MTALFLKVTIVFAAALLVRALAYRAAASTRHAILVAAQFVALLLPLLAFVLPPMKVDVANAKRAVRPAAPAVVAASPANVTLPEPIVKEKGVDLAMLWMIGVAAFALMRFTSYVRAANIVRRAEPFDEVLISAEVEQPVTLGNRIVLPQGAQSWDRARRDSVLLHERAHVARHDSLLGVIGDVASAVYWFHPLVWVIARKAMFERERACDEIVLARGVAPTCYAGAIVDVARSVMQRRHTLGMAMADRSHLETRVVAILDPSLRRRGTRAARSLVIICAIAIAPLLAALTPRGIEPDLLDNELASPYSERIVIREIPNVPAAGPDAALIARMNEIARIPQRDDIDFVAYRARWALRQVRNGELVMPLIEALRDDDWRIRAYAAFGLGIARDRRATLPLIDLLEQENWRVRAMAASSLALIADPIAAGAMHVALEDDAWQVRFEAVHYFDAVGADRTLFEALKNDRHMAVRSAAEEALQ